MLEKLEFMTLILTAVPDHGVIADRIPMVENG